MSDTILVAIITACATTIPGIIVAIINNFFQLKFKKLEAYELAKRNALIDFNEKATEYCSNDLKNGKVEYEKSLNNLYIYFPSFNDLNISVLNNARSVSDNVGDKNLYFSQLSKTIKQLSNLLKK